MTKFSPLYNFSDWPNSELPSVAAGVYAIWREKTLIYCGMSGRSIESAIKTLTNEYMMLLLHHISRYIRTNVDMNGIWIRSQFDHSTGLL